MRLSFNNMHVLYIITKYNWRWPGGIMISVYATGPNDRGFKPGRGNGFLRTIKFRSTTYFEREVKPSAPRREILRHVKELYEVLKKYFVHKIHNFIRPAPD
jgi:hypothetical protein